MEHLTTGLGVYFKDFNFKENFKGIASNVRGDVLAGITVAMVVSADAGGERGRRRR